MVTTAKKTVTQSRKVKKATAKKTSKKTAPKSARGTGEKKTVRVRALEALRKGPLTAAQVKEAIGLGHALKPTLDQEVERHHLQHSFHPEEKGVAIYEITKEGRSALSNGSIAVMRKKKG